MVRRKKDLRIILKKHCYRIPLKRCPVQRFAYLAFYEVSRLGEEGKAINYYARLKTESEAKRIELLPDEPEHPRAEEIYRVYHLGKIQRTSKRIKNHSRRRISFGFTTREKLLHSEEISQLFNIPPLEDIMAKELKRRKIKVYREYPLRLAKIRRYRLDFAIIDQKSKIAVECDNEKWHLRPSQKQKDRIRDSTLKRMGWIVLRFRGKEILKNVSGCVDRIEKALKLIDCTR
ncbi:MAG: DUF559 domain-containing protein [Candidatus Omnitrophica bacterium]|nr:DUF559 domain-containing protein [Candidatus Omnitrophota bacterium]